MSVQGSSQKAEIENNSGAPVVSDALAALKLVREFNCAHAPALMHLPFFQNMDAAVFNALSLARSEGIR